jgi:hypothetical protein
LPEQPEPYDDRRLAERRRREPHALQRDGAERRVGGLGEAYRVGHAHAEVARDRQKLRVRGVADARAGYAVADAEALDLLAHLLDRAGRAVAERQRLFELGADGADGARQALLAGAAHHLADQLGLFERAANKPLAVLPDGGTLRARANERGGGADQQAPAPRRRRRHVGHLHGARLSVL